MIKKLFLFTSLSYFMTQTTFSQAEIKVCSGKTISYVQPDYRLTFEGSMFEIRKIFREKYNDSLFKTLPNNSGIITIHFEINCKGITENFSTQVTGLDYQPIDLSPTLVSELENIVKKMEGWKPTFLNDETIGKQTAFLAFRIINGEIIDIMPYY